MYTPTKALLIPATVNTNTKCFPILRTETKYRLAANEKYDIKQPFISIVIYQLSVQ